ncbi:MAG: RNA-binding S4 domain-containing protein [Acidobacteria bacterium]|nr:RNA-binding S4 domain-containing protein [Acidobacteriota bacterium]
MNSVRADKWLWAARFFKTRALAAKACELGRILLKNQPIKPAREIHAGDVLRVGTPGGEFEITVLGLSETRGPASEAQLLYTESEESQQRRRELAEARKLSAQIEVLPTIKPTGRDRRKLDRFRGRNRD